MKKVAWLSTAMVVAAGSALIAQQAVQPGQQRDPAQAGQSQNESQLGQNQAGRDAQTGQTAGSREMDKKFIENQLKCNQMEIQACKLVSEKAQRPEVKRFCQTLIDDHTQAVQQIKQVAQQVGVTDTEGKLEQWQQAKLDAMRQKPAEELETAFIFEQVGNHVTEILKNRCAATKAQNPEVKQLAQSMIPKLEQHLNQANRIAEQLAGGPGVRIMGTPVSDHSPIDRTQQDRDRERSTEQRGQQGQGFGQQSGQGQSGQSGQFGQDQTGQRDRAGQSGQNNRGQ
jgi:putative membrane protein